MQFHVVVLFCDMYGILVRVLARGGVAAERATHVGCCRPLATSSVHLHARTVNKPQLKTSTPGGVIGRSCMVLPLEYRMSVDL